MADVLLTIEGNRATLTGKPGNALLALSARLEGMKRWLKSGGFSFEPTPMNMEAFRAAYPDAVIEGDVPGVFDNHAVRAVESRCQYKFKTQPFPFQGVALRRSAGWGGGAAGPGVPGQGQPPAAAHREPPAATFQTPENPPAGPGPEPGPGGAGQGGGANPPAKVFAILGEMGTGKTKILIDTAGMLWCLGLIDALLIISPKGVHEQWIEEQLPKHMGIPWSGDAVDGRKELPEWKRNALAVLSVNIDYPSRTKDGFENCMAFIERFKGRVLLVVDESHYIKSLGSDRTDKVIRLGEACSFKRIATGTPLSLNLVDAYSQFYFLDPSILGQKYITSFKAEYCVTDGAGRDERIIGHKNVEQFWARIADYSFRITKEEADLGLPPKNYIRFAFDMSPEQRHHYMAMKNDMISRMDSGQLVNPTTVMVQMLRLQQISCGWLTDIVRTEQGEREQIIQRLNNARIEALKEVLAEREGKVVIWARFVDDIQAIKDLLGDEAVTYDGSTSDTQRAKAKAEFLDPNSRVRYFVSNPQAGGVGLNLQGDCRTVIYYSNSFNAIDRWQSEDRVHRIGAKGSITYIDLVARGSMDVKILSNLRNKKSISDLAFDDIRKIVE